MRVFAERQDQTVVHPGMKRCPLCRRLREPQDWYVRAWEISSLPGFDTRTVQPVTRRFTDCAVPAHKKKNMSSLFCDRKC
jgi:hypothetical protein